MFEVILISFIIGLCSSAIMLTTFKHKTHKIEAISLLILSILFGMLFRYMSTTSLSKDTEYWGTRFERVEYYEPWDEYIYEECTQEVPCGTDANGNTITCSETYDCSYVEEHPAKYVKYDHLGNSYSTDRLEYTRLLRKNNNTKFTDLRRDYHSYDGDMYYTVWDKNYDNYEMITSIHSYENKTQVAPTVFQYVDVDTMDVNFYGLYDYPRYDRDKHYQPCLLGVSDPVAEHKLQILNGELGDKKQVRAYIIVFKNQPIAASTYQQSYWKGGNKNEVLITIGIDDDDNIKWSNVFSWSDKESFKIQIRDFIILNKKLNILKTIEYTKEQLLTDFERKEFSDFDYIEVEMTFNQYIGLFIANIILNIILSIIFIKNNFE